MDNKLPDGEDDRKIHEKISSSAILKIIKPSTLFWVPTVIALLSIFLAILYFLSIGFVDEIFYREVCFSPSCLKNFKDFFLPVYDLLAASLAWVVASVTVLAAFTAVQTYQLSVHNNILANHIAHFDMFRNYLEGEINKLPRIDRKSVDIFKFFSLIFPNSRKGEFVPSNRYKEFVKSVNNSILIAEQKYSGEKSEVFFSFKEHQGRVRQLLADCGIDIAIKPSETDFYRVEKDVYQLLNGVNECFCASHGVDSIRPPQYS